MGEKTQQPVLRLVDDPVARTMGMLVHLPLESMAAYLEMITRQADQLGLLSEEHRERIAELLRQVSTRHVDRAA